MPRTNGWSCCARQMGSAAARSSALKLTKQRVPVEQLVALQEPGRAAQVPFGHAPAEPGLDDRQRLRVEAMRRRGELVEEADLLRREPVASAQRGAHASAALAPGGAVDQEGCRHLRGAGL